MTIAMADAADSATLPGGYPAYAAYVDGHEGDQPNAARVAAAHPGVHVLTIALDPAHDADALDVEPLAAKVSDIPGWYARQKARGVERPCLYASTSTMGAQIAPALAGWGIERPAVRLWSAHYGLGLHVCGPSTCKAAYQADGTQWTSTYTGLGGSKIDVSCLSGDFFGAPAEWVFSAVRGFKVAQNPDGREAIGPHSAKFTWSSPGSPEAEAVAYYQLTVRLDGQDVAEPAKIAKGANPQLCQWDDLRPGTVYEAWVRACAVDGHASPWSVVTFRTDPA